MMLAGWSYALHSGICSFLSIPSQRPEQRGCGILRLPRRQCADRGKLSVKGKVFASIHDLMLTEWNQLSLFEVAGNMVRHCKSIFSKPFYVYTAKKFPGMEREYRPAYGFSMVLILPKKAPSCHVAWPTKASRFAYEKTYGYGGQRSRIANDSGKITTTMTSLSS